MKKTPVLLATFVAVLSSLMISGPPAQAFPGGSFFVTCSFVKRAKVDPIVDPGVQPTDHEHMFFGNLGINKNSTYSSLLAGRTNCSTSKDRSAYWIPTFMRNGSPLIPTSLNVYYVARGKDRVAFKPGFTVVSDDVWYSCGGGGGSRTPSDCGRGHPQINIRFLPSNSLPEVHAQFKFDNIHSLKGAKMVSDGMMPRHGDMFFAWDPTTLSSLVKNCLNTGKTCGRIKG